MPSLQIRELPDDVYQALSLRSEREHRSLAQQALVDLQGRYAPARSVVADGYWTGSEQTSWRVAAMSPRSLGP